MNKAEEVIGLMDEVLGSPVKNVDQLVHGKTVMFKPGHQFAGLIARVARAKDGKADVYVGSSLRVDIPIGDLLLAPEINVGKP